jgi:DNA (cytosine-5)-methyltransferase 1
MQAVDLFAGAGGLSIGIERAGFTARLANEIETDMARTYAHNHTDTRVINRDIHEVDFGAERRSLRIKKKQLDLLCGGPPCQGFSTVGSKRRQDPRNSLFYEFLRAVDAFLPKYVIFENVAGFKRLYNGQAYETLLTEFAEMGYHTDSGILEASQFGLAQVRKRTIVLASRKDCAFAKLPVGDPARALSLMDAISDLPPIGANESAETYLTEPQNDYQRMMRGGVKVLTEHNASNYGAKMRKILELVPPGGSVKDLPPELQPENYFGNTYARLWPDRPAPTITRNFGTPSSSRCIHPFQNRALSTREGARLQGFPDHYQFQGGKTSKNLQIGNAVPPILGEVVARQVADALSHCPGGTG